MGRRLQAPLRRGVRYHLARCANTQLIGLSPRYLLEMFRAVEPDRGSVDSQSARSDGGRGWAS